MAHVFTPTVDVSPDAHVGDGSYIWNIAQIREGRSLSATTSSVMNVYVDYGVVIGNEVKLQNNMSIYYGVFIEKVAGE
jgi:UDP-3-O-[3-hydroxymyristoyl] glucosamine N-acyltransferase